MFLEGWLQHLKSIPAKIKIIILCIVFLLLTLIILFATYGIVKHISGRTFYDGSSSGSRVDSNEQDNVEPVPLPQGKLKLNLEQKN